MINTLSFVKNVGRYGTDNRIMNRLLHSLMPGAFPVASTNRIYQLYLRANRKFTEFMGKKNFVWLQISPTVRYFSSAFDEPNGNEIIVHHDANERIFYVDGGGYIDYERKDDLIILKHTFVSNERGGRGVGKMLAKEALAYVAKNDLQLEVQCSFIRKYVSKYEPK